jgi:hypothetical protein
MALVENAPVEEEVEDDYDDEEDELEEGEILVTDDDDDDDEEEEEFDDDDEVPGLGDIADIAASLFATPDGDTVASALVGIREQLETQNRILIKILSTLKD